MTRKSIGWLGIVRLGLVQSALGAIVVLTTSTLNRVMVVEMALPASLPAALVAWHYVIQLSRPRWGYGSDVGRSRTPWIVCGMGVLALGALIAANATVMFNDFPVMATILAVLAFTMIGAGVAAAGTSLLALLATEVSPERRPAAASITWIMMIVGIVITAATTGQLLDPYSPQRLMLVASGVAGVAFVLTLIAVAGVERGAAVSMTPEREQPMPFREAVSQIWQEKTSRDFAIFVFLSMLAYSAQDLILEPYAGIVFQFTLGQSTSLAGIQHGGVLAGMVLVGLAGTLVRGDRTIWMRRSTMVGCVLSAISLLALSAAGFEHSDWALQPTVFVLGFSNGVFAVSAIALMMALAGKGEPGREGLRLGVWGAAQAMAFGFGGFAGAAGLDVMRGLVESSTVAFAAVFSAEAILFLIAALLALRLGRSSTHQAPPSSNISGQFQFGAGQ